MTPFAKIFDKAYARVLVKIAEGDLRTAEILLKNPGGRVENTFYLAQQSIEKSLKSVICHLEKPVPLTHDASALLSILPDTMPKPPSAELINELNEFATVRRYEEGFYHPTNDEVSAAVILARGIVEWAKQIVSSK